VEQKGRELPLVETPMSDEAVFLHSMFRTGSTFLAARFAADPRYLMFYEPFHGGLASLRGTLRSQRDYEAARAGLGHDHIADGYWSAYLARDPQTGRTPRDLYRVRFGVHDVLNGLSDQGARYLEACGRTAAGQGRVPVFGFCRSGLQVAAMKRRLPGRHLHLARDPRWQFASYETAGPDYFVPQTLLHLIASERLAPAVLTLSGLSRRWAPTVRRLSLHLPPPALARLGRTLALGLDTEARYAVFYLAWLACDAHGREHAALSFTLMDAVRVPERRRLVEDALGLPLDGLRPTDGTDPPLDFRAGAVEARVEALLP